MSGNLVNRGDSVKTVGDFIEKADKHKKGMIGAIALAVAAVAMAAIRAISKD